MKSKSRYSNSGNRTLIKYDNHSLSQSKTKNNFHHTINILKVQSDNLQSKKIKAELCVNFINKYIFFNVLLALVLKKTILLVTLIRQRNYFILLSIAQQLLLGFRHSLQKCLVDLKFKQ